MILVTSFEPAVMLEMRAYSTYHDQELYGLPVR